MRRERWRAEHWTWMMMSGVIALCALVVVAALVLPRFGPRIAAASAAAVVVGIFIICYLVCVPGAVWNAGRGRPRRAGSPSGVRRPDGHRHGATST